MTPARDPLAIGPWVAGGVRGRALAAADTAFTLAM
jgi:hypothetical protein